MFYGGSRNFEGGHNNVSAPLSFFANAHNELHPFYMEKAIYTEKILRPVGEDAPTLESAAVVVVINLW